MSTKKTEDILVIEAIGNEQFLKEGFQEVDKEELAALLNKGVFKTRYKMEEDPTYKQIIPYVVIMNEKNEILSYKRSKEGGDSRLHNSYSIGIGGHLDKQPGDTLGTEVYIEGMIREVFEEIGLVASPEDFIMKGLIYDSANDVGRVHLGVVSFLHVESEIFNRELGELDILTDRKFIHKDNDFWVEQFMENWSKIIFKNRELFNK